MTIRFGRKTENSWKFMELNSRNVEKDYKKRNGRIMFPSSHDITPSILESCLIVLNKLLSSGNEILITSKPHLSIVKEICETFQKYQNQIQFRFTIGSINNRLLNFWEPGVPEFEERLNSLRFAYDLNYKTSVSIEPFLDYDPVPLVTVIDPFVNETIWIGIMHYINRNKVNAADKPYYEDIRRNYTLEHVYEIYLTLKDNPHLRWKDSIKKMLTL